MHCFGIFYSDYDSGLSPIRHFDTTSDLKSTFSKFEDFKYKLYVRPK